MSSQNLTLDPREADLLSQIKKELSLEHPRDAVRLLASVLQGLRQTLTLQNANTLLNKLPDFLKLVFASNWKRDESHVPVEHLDEFVSLVMDREKTSGRSFFKNEVQALSVIVLTLKKMYTLIDLDHFEGLSKAFRQELREIPAEAAA
jgi:uncharacterized protein (DUF2267 family)